ncbi:uncharacterized protein Nmag_3599 [Natrialba magadii ATCC 43099]|uniref:Uncharacterized protein n=1 Tax=Natrialba magadii (strain ATCC 43099 / DSM 3394 / CCM 3739 / CIP 104546 / IAM 13178 / JCM 8861 / NBRC 102185 / NCIMB 2190 / MS3) TaxID=547559 RepID=D3SU60_NATMM|nr:hypothetical protein [Natrialba magadii]ADD07149.1 uncharacterized protein Nmag_3599 [Natrialba magadii ATCC 43099]ELY29075.1 hypothetical protein C500_12220 [Natrialba magadii ATCC 43099]
MSLAAETRRAVEAHPFLVTALRAGVANYTAAARFLSGDESDAATGVGESSDSVAEIDGDIDAIATALRRYAEELPAQTHDARDVSVRMESSIGTVDDPGSALVTVGGTAFGSNGGDLTAIYATGAVDAAALAATLESLAVAKIEPVAAAVGNETLIVIVERREGANAVRTVEAALERVPSTE